MCSCVNNEYQYSTTAVTVKDVQIKVNCQYRSPVTCLTNVTLLTL